MTDLSLEQFLAREADAGQAQESGSFTIEIGSALEKMRRYRFDDPNSHLLYAVRSAVLAGGRDMTISSPAGCFKIRFFLDEPGRYGQMASLVKSLAQVEIEDSLNAQLTLALQGALNLCPNGAEWIHIRGRKRETLWCGPAGVHIERNFTAHADPLESEFRFVESWRPSGVQLHGKMPGLLEFLWHLFFPSSSKTRLQERLENLRQRLRVLPLEVKIFGQPIERIGEIEKPQVLQLAKKRVLQRGFWVIKNPVHQLYLDASVSADGLSTDLSGLKLIRDEALRARISEIHELAKRRLFRCR